MVDQEKKDIKMNKIVYGNERYMAQREYHSKIKSIRLGMKQRRNEINSELSFLTTYSNLDDPKTIEQITKLFEELREIEIGLFSTRKKGIYYQSSSYKFETQHEPYIGKRKEN